jgi:hypothetical protein
MHRIVAHVSNSFFSIFNYVVVYNLRRFIYRVIDEYQNRNNFHSSR